MKASWVLALLFVAATGVAAELPMPDAAEITQSERRPTPAKPMPGLQQLIVTNYALEYHLKAIALELERAAEASAVKPNLVGVLGSAGANVALTADMAQALRVGTRANLRSNNGTIGAAIALDLLGALFGGKSEQDIRLKRWREMQAPSLYFLSIRLPSAPDSATDAAGILASGPGQDAVPTASADQVQPASAPASAAKRSQLPPPPPSPEEIKRLDEAFDEAVALLMSSDLGCEPGQIKTTTLGKYLPRGEYRPGNLHARSFVCGAKDRSDLGIYEFYPQLREVRVTRIGRDATGASPLAGGLLLQVDLHGIDTMKDARMLLDPDSKVALEELPRHILLRVNPELRSQWTAVSTAVNDGKRQIVVSNDAGELTFDMPKRP